MVGRVRGDGVEEVAAAVGDASGQVGFVGDLDGVVAEPGVAMGGDLAEALVFSGGLRQGRVSALEVLPGPGEALVHLIEVTAGGGQLGLGLVSTWTQAVVRRACIYIDHHGATLGPPKTVGAIGGASTALVPTVVDLLRRRRTTQAAERLACPDPWPDRVYDGRPVDLVFTTPTGGLKKRSRSP